MAREHRKDYGARAQKGFMYICCIYYVYYTKYILNTLSAPIYVPPQQQEKALTEEGPLRQTAERPAQKPAK